MITCNLGENFNGTCSREEGHSGPCAVHMNNFTYKVVIGDWSCDGHEKYNFVYFKTNKKQEDIKGAYNKAVSICGVTLDNHYKAEVNYDEILNMYEDRRIKLDQVEKLKLLGLTAEKLDFFVEDNGDWSDIDTEGVARFFLEMVKSQMPDMEYKILSDEVKCINGFWSEDFNLQFGYGIYQ